MQVRDGVGAQPHPPRLLLPPGPKGECLIQIKEERMIDAALHPLKQTMTDEIINT